MTYKKLSSNLKESLSRYGFKEHIEYVDALGGLVLDAYRGNERITCIVSPESLQVLSYVNESITSTEFTRNRDDSLKAMEYLRTLLEESSTAEVDTS